MGGVYCPTCEASVEVTAKFCLSCGHDLGAQGPITATGHDLNQLKDVIRTREDLSMAEKFDMIARIEDGADPIKLGIAAAADDGQHAHGEPGEAPVELAPALQQAEWTSPAADAAVALVAGGSKLLDLKNAGAFDKLNETFSEAMNLGRDATIELIKVSQGMVLPADEALEALPIMQPPNKSFCPKCGSDIHANAMLQWQKWSSASTDLLTVQLEAAMRSSLMHLAASYRDKIQDLEDQLSDAKKAVEKAKQQAAATPAPAEEPAASEGSKKKATGKKAAAATSAPKKPKSTPAKPKVGGLFGAKKPKKTYEGEPGGKAEWFLEEALDTVYDPHGTGKPVKAAMILARSSEGNVRVRDVIRTYAVEGEEGVSELAWTSPLTKYLIEAYDAC